MADATIWGYVYADGTKKSGSGFEVDHDGNNAPGVYYIRFNPAFTDVPAVNITIVNQDYTSGWWVNTLIANLTESECEVVMVESDDKTKHDSDFAFTAVGLVD
jgi:hypothetical protein